MDYQCCERWRHHDLGLPQFCANVLQPFAGSGKKGHDRASFLHGIGCVERPGGQVGDHPGRLAMPGEGEWSSISLAPSPSMRINCPLRPLSDIQTDAFLVAYGDDATAKTFHAWRAILTWRFACYAGYRAGAVSFRSRLAAEIDLLERLGNRIKMATDPPPIPFT